MGEKDTGGMNVYVLNLARELGQLGHFVEVFTRYHDPSDPEIVKLDDRVNVVHIEAGPHNEEKAYLPAHVDSFVNNVRQYASYNSVNYDIVHSNYWLSGLTAVTLSDLWNVPHVATFHTLAKTKMRARAGEEESKERSDIERQIMDSATGVLVLTDVERQDIVNLYQINADKIQVISGGVDTDTFYQIPKDDAKDSLGFLNPHKKTILYVGRIEPIKGLDVLLDAMKILKESQEVQLIIVGGNLSDDTNLNKLRDQAKNLGINQDVFFTGSLEQSKLKNYYSAADVFVLPSHYESFGLVALEAMACGTPVIASRVGGISSFVQDGADGYLVPWRCPEPFSDRIEVLLKNDPLREYMGNSAKKKAHSLNWKKIAHRVSEYYCYVSQCDSMDQAV
ncbi:MAG: glycosyltransferase [Dehalococcoidia bacterium]